MSRVKTNSSLLSKYTLIYEKNSRSRVFAPLAETYRKLGMYNEAFSVLTNGIKIHPTYTLGYIVLASCYYDQKKIEQAYDTVRPFVKNNLENIRLQKLYGKCCVTLGLLEEALNTFKGLLLISPRDSYFAEQVKFIEDDLLVNLKNSDLSAEEEETDENNWIQVDLSEDKIDMNPEDFLKKFKEEIKKPDLSIVHHELDDKFFKEDFDNDALDVITAEEDNVAELEEKPIITHTLVDLYCSQGHASKAIEILEDILKLHPNDKATQRRLAEIVGPIAASSSALIKERDDELAGYAKVEEAFSLFQAKLRERSMYE